MDPNEYELRVRSTFARGKDEDKNHEETPQEKVRKKLDEEPENV